MPPAAPGTVGDVDGERSDAAGAQQDGSSGSGGNAKEVEAKLEDIDDEMNQLKKQLAALEAKKKKKKKKKKNGGE